MFMGESEIVNRLTIVNDRISNACLNSGRKNDVLLLAVSKTKSADEIRVLWQAGVKNFGENYLQEALAKIDALHDCNDICWHFIGSLQSNKTKYIAEHFDWFHALDRLKIAQRLSEQRPNHLPPLNICIQVNIGSEATKSGVTGYHELLELTETVRKLPNLKLKGLMAIPIAESDPQKQLAEFEALRDTKTKLENQLSITLDTLSMGMSADLEQAIVAGSTIVRVGTALFGDRN